MTPAEVIACTFAVQPAQRLIIDQAPEAARIHAEAKIDELSRARLLVCAEYLAGPAGVGRPHTRRRPLV